VYQEFEVTKTFDNETSEIAIRDIAIQSQPLNQDQTQTVDHTPYRSFANRDMERHRGSGL
jgi:hypothetical protein